MPLGMIATTKILKGVKGIHGWHRDKHMLSQVWAKEGAKALRSNWDNLKHHAVLSRFCTCDSKDSESFNLRTADVDSNIDLLVNCNASGKKDSPNKIMEGLQDHYSAYYPLEWLFEGQEARTEFSEPNLQSIMKQAVAKAKINKPVSLLG